MATPANVTQKIIVASQLVSTRKETHGVVVLEKQLRGGVLTTVGWPLTACCHRALQTWLVQTEIGCKCHI